MDIDNKYLDSFLKRLRKSHFVVDYTTQDRDFLIAQLEKMITLDTEHASKSIPQEALRNSVLDIYSNQLNTHCEKFLQKAIKDAEANRVTVHNNHAHRLEKVTKAMS